jgi:hypothetical protein
MMSSDSIREGHCRIASQYASQYQCGDERIRLSTTPVQAALWPALDELGQRGEHAAFPTIVNSTSSIELDRTQDKTCQLRGETLWIIAQLSPRSNSPDNRDILGRQNKCEVASGGVLSIGSCDLHANGFFIGHDEESLFQS